MTDSTAKRCLAICPLFEAELLVELMLIKWGHPFAGEESFCQGLVESGDVPLIVKPDDGLLGKYDTAGLR